MKIYRIKNELGHQLYIIASDVSNAIKKFEEKAKETEINFAIKEIEFVDFCIMGE